jgi:hypothetical protein
MSRAPELYSECGGRVGQDQLSLSLLPNTRPAAPLCEKEKKNEKRKRKAAACPIQANDGSFANDGIKILLLFCRSNIRLGRPEHNLGETSDIVKRMSFIIRIIILVPCWNFSKRFPRFLRYFLLVLDAMNALTRATSSLDMQSAFYFNPKPSLSVTAAHSFSSSFLRLP